LVASEAGAARAAEPKERRVAMVVNFIFEELCGCLKGK